MSMIGCHVRLLTRCSTGFSTIVPLESGKFSRDARILSNQCDMANHNDYTIPKCVNTRSNYQFNPWRRSGKRERGRAHSPTHAQAKRSQFPSQTAHSLHNTTPPQATHSSNDCRQCAYTWNGRCAQLPAFREKGASCPRKNRPPPFSLDPREQLTKCFHSKVLDAEFLAWCIVEELSPNTRA